MIRRILIHILFRLLANGKKSDYQGLNRKLIDDWLFRQFQDMGYREYTKLRDLELMKAMSVGVTRETYTLLLGEKLEIMKLLQKVDDAYKRKQRELDARKAKDELRKNSAEAQKEDQKQQAVKSNVVTKN